jgi:CheY-like chemotaxis protein
MLPGEDGLSICRRLRARSAVPIIMLTAKSDDIDRIVGLELGDRLRASSWTSMRVASIPRMAAACR